MGYCCVYHGQLFLPGFLLLTETSSCVPGASNCNKEDMTIMSSVTQDDIIKTVMLSFRFGSVTRLIGGEQRVINSTSTVDSA